MKKLLSAFLLTLILGACVSVPSHRSLAAKVVPVNVELVGEFYNFRTNTYSEKTYCSGFIISPRAVVTAGHCTDVANEIQEWQGKVLFDNKIKLRLADGRIVLAKILVSDFVEGDNQSSRDVALLMVEEGGLEPGELGNSTSLHVGDHVAIVGNTFGELTNSFTIGVVSYIGRKLEVGTFIQTDALAGPGNSGGPVFDMDGKIVGMLTRGGEGVSLFLPINDVLAHILQVHYKGL